MIGFKGLDGNNEDIYLLNSVNRSNHTTGVILKNTCVKHTHRVDSM